MEENKLIIDKDTNLWKIWNRDIYTKLTIDHMYKYKLQILNMRKFNNVKELIITNNDGIADYKYAECMINHFDFIHQLEKITYKNIKNYGEEFYSSKKFILDAPNLKSIEFPSCVNTIYNNYLKKTKKLEEIIFNISYDTSFNYDDGTGVSYDKGLNVSNTNLKNIILKTEYDRFKVNPEYKPEYIYYVVFINGKIYLKFANKNITSEAESKNGKVIIKNVLKSISDDLINNGCLYIPDYITKIKIEENKALKNINKISLNLKLLSSDTNKNYPLINKISLNDISSIIVRNDNEMALFQQKEYDVKNYGKIKDLYTDDEKLYINFEFGKIEIDKDGQEKKDLAFNNVKDNSNNQQAPVELLNNLTNVIYQKGISPFYKWKLIDLFKKSFKKNIGLEYNKCLNFIEYYYKNQEVLNDYHIPSLGKMLVMCTKMDMKDPSIIYKLMDLIISNSKTNSCSNANKLFYYMMVSKGCYQDDERWYNRVVEVINNNVDTKIALKDDYSITGICPNLYDSEIIKLHDLITGSNTKESIKAFIDIKDIIGDKTKENNITNLDNFTSNQLEYYMYYKKLLDFLYTNEDKNLNGAFETIKTSLVKKLDNSKGE